MVFNAGFTKLAHRKVDKPKISDFARQTNKAEAPKQSKIILQSVTQTNKVRNISRPARKKSSGKEGCGFVSV